MVTRRVFLRSTTAVMGAFITSKFLAGCNNDGSTPPLSTTQISLLNDIGPLLPPDENGVMLPQGFTSRIIANSGLRPHQQSNFIWHDAPDGGATFPTNDGGWIYVSNSEIGNNLGGVGAIRFDSSGNIIDAYSILSNSNRNCAGGTTPWNTWLSCEEHEAGIIWECDPFGLASAIKRPALGTFAHEAIAIDSITKYCYMTEDKLDGCLYRYVPGSIDSQGRPDLEKGVVEVAVVEEFNSKISWVALPEPNAISTPTRYQVAASTRFSGGEGIVFHNNIISFATKGDNKIWSYNTISSILSTIYDFESHETPILTGVDNIALSLEGELIVGEDGGNMQIVAITKTGKLVPLVQLVGHEGSEVTGPSFSADGSRLYFSSQRGTTNTSSGGITLEVSGPFHGMIN
jgi:uncharacterized protein